MQYTLMHKNMEVADIEIDEETGSITRIIDVYREEHLPVGVVRTIHHNKQTDRSALHHWWSGRSIPASRSGIREALGTLEIYDTKILMTRCLGLSLSDQYWIKPENTGLTWEQVNFFDNDFSEDIGDILFGAPKKEIGFDFCSPDNTSDGNLKKRWKIIDGKRCLIKAGDNPYWQQPFNELIATKIMERLAIPHVSYRVIWENGYPYSVCEDFVTPETELVSAWRILQVRPKENHENTYLHFINICKELGVPDVTASIDRMIVLDYLIANEDRHLNNFGLLRNADTLEWIGAAPIFDSGTSLWYNTMESHITKRDVLCKPFKKTHGEQLKLVSSFDWLDFSRLDGVKEEIADILSGEAVRSFIDESRSTAIAEAVEKRIQNLHTIAMMQPRQTISNVQAFDVEEDVTASYEMKME